MTDVNNFFPSTYAPDQQLKAKGSVDLDHKWMENIFLTSFMQWSADRHIGFQDDPTIIICEEL